MKTNKIGIKIAVVIIKFYQKLISPALPVSCRFYPTCSYYTLQALLKHGVNKGSWKALKRLARFHPFNAGGYDPVK